MSNIPDARTIIIDGGGAAAPTAPGDGFRPLATLGLKASDIPVADTGGLIDAQEVQGALQEIASDLAASGGSANPWQGSAGSYHLPTVGGSDVGTVRAKVKTNPPGNDAEMLQLLRPGQDLSTGISQNGPATVGVVVGAEGEITAENITDAGMFFYSRYLLTMQKFVPLVLQSGERVFFNTAGSPSPLTKLVGIVVPHIGVNVVGGGQLAINGDVIGIWLDGSADLNGNIVHSGRKISILAGDALASDQGLYLGAAGQTKAFVDFGDGTNSGVTSAGHGFITYIPGQGFVHANEGIFNYHPLSNQVQHQSNYDPSARTYPTGITVLQTLVPADTTVQNLQTITPARWTLPAAISISGGALQPGLRFVLNTGLSAPIYNDSASPLSQGRGEVFLGIQQARITGVQLIVNNTSGSTSSSQDIGNYVFEGVYA